MSAKKNIVELNTSDVERIKKSLVSILNENKNRPDDVIDDMNKIIPILDSFLALYGMWKKSKKKMNKILRMMFGNRSEKSEPISGKSNAKPSGEISEQNDSEETISGNSNEGKKEEKKKREGGGGKNGVEQYTGAEVVTCPLCSECKPPAICPACRDNKLYWLESRNLIRLIGSPPVNAVLFDIERSGCSCSEKFEGDIPEKYKEIYEQEKYSSSAVTAMAINKYMMGISFGTLAKIQEYHGIPLPESTQSNILKQKMNAPFLSICDMLCKMSANSNLFGIDDTTITLLSKRITTKNTETNKGYGTAIVCDGMDHLDNTIYIYDFNFENHAGPVLFELLSKRERDTLPILISDGLPAYDSYKKGGIDTNCNSHARRKMVEYDPEKKNFVVSSVIAHYQTIYKNEKQCNNLELSPIEKMKYHKKHSSESFDSIHALFRVIVGDIPSEDLKTFKADNNIPDYIDKEETGDDLYVGAKYFIDRFEKLTRILNIPGVPLDTNYVERAIKAIIKLRKNSLFFNNPNSAEYSGKILSVLETAAQSGVNIFEYTKHVLENSEDVIKNPAGYLPWLYDKSGLYKKEYWRKVAALNQRSSSSSGFANLSVAHS